MARRLPRDPLAPIDAVVGIGWYFCMALLACFGVIAVVNNVANLEERGPSIASFGTDDACVELDNHHHDVSVADPGPKSITYGTEWGRDGVNRDIATVRTETVELCIETPTFVHRMAASVGSLGGVALLLGFLHLTRHVVIRARLGRLFSELTADGIQRIGWLLALGSVLLGLATSWGQGVILAAAVDSASVADAFWPPDVNLLVFTAGVAAISVARVLRWAVALQEDADTTV